jgi:hypothetical protein
MERREFIGTTATGAFGALAGIWRGFCPPGRDLWSEEVSAIQPCNTISVSGTPWQALDHACKYLEKRGTPAAAVVARPDLIEKMKESTSPIVMGCSVIENTLVLHPFSCQNIFRDEVLPDGSPDYNKHTLGPIVRVPERRLRMFRDENLADDTIILIVEPGPAGFKFLLGQPALGLTTIVAI